MNLIAYRPQRTVRTQTTSTFRPATNILETEDNFRLELAAPGYAKENFDLQIDNDILILSATVEETTDEQTTVLRRQFRPRDFERHFELPDTIDTNGLSASYENGILTVLLPKREEAKPQPARKIEIA